MKTRSGFVSNSSATSFIIENKTDEILPLEEFIKENSHLIDQFEKEYFPIVGGVLTKSHTGEGIKLNSRSDVVTQMCRDAAGTTLDPGTQSMTFGDEDCTLLGEIYDYILRNGGESARFKWHFDHYER